ncbi:MAG: conserved rane protein multidrug efflux associated [Myxococcaceae bacterium]|nr:conserved rane protein multidrug efflux associated [Myxococcaceae bacterium]
MRRYLTLLAIQIKAAALLSLQYRLDFFFQLLMSLFWTTTALVPLWVLFSMRTGVAGWSAHEALIVSGFFIALKGVLQGVIQPSLTNVVEHIRKGTLDFLLLKPVDAQFLLSTSKLELPHAVDVLAGFALAAWATGQTGHRPSALSIGLSLLLVLCALAILYAIWILVVSLAFKVVKIDNLSYLIVSTFDAARWPSSVFRGALAFVFTFIVPLSLMTTYPALALLGKLSVRQAATSVAVAVCFLYGSRQVWLRSVRSYTGAGG